MVFAFLFLRAVRFLLRHSLLRGAAALVLGLALVSGAGAAQLTLRWQDNSNNESGFHIERSAGGGSFAQIATTGANVVSYTDATLSASATYQYRVRAFNSAGTSAYTNIASATTGAGGGGGSAPPPASAGNLTAADIGGPSPAGSASYSSGAYAISAGGADIWDGSDQFHFAQQQVSGDATLVVRVSSLANSDAWAKAGLMLRSSLAASSAHVSVFVTPANGVVMQWRSQSGQTSFTSASVSATAPRWLKLQRQGNSFTAYQSSNGSQWQQVHQAITVSLGSSAYGGLAVTSHRNGTATTAGFDQFSVTSGSGATPPANTAPTISDITNRTINQGANTGAISFTVADAQTSAGSLTLSSSSSNTTLVPNASIVFGGSGGNRTVTVTPAANQSGTATITVTVSDGSLTASDAFTLTVSAPSIPPPSTGAGVFTGADIGGPSPAGSTTFDSGSGVYTIRAGGADIWDGSDQFHFAQRQISGDTDVIVRVNSLGNTNAWAKAGVMLRASLAANAPHASVFVTPSNGVVMQWRGQTGQSSLTSNSSSGGAPVWLRLQRQGSTFTGYRSSDGVSWTQVHRVNVSLPTAAYGGLAVTSHANGTATTAAFRSLSIPNLPASGGGGGSGGSAPSLSSSDIGSPGKAGQMWITSTGHEISAGGADIWDSSDQFHFARHQVSGDAEMTVRVKTLSNSDSWAKAGLMFRGSLAANSAHVSVFVTPSNGVVLQWRNANGSNSSTSLSIPGGAPKWLRLMRTGNTFYAFHSADGASWDLVDYVQVNLPSTTYAGLAVTSHNAGATTYAVFENFQSD